MFSTKDHIILVDMNEGQVNGNAYILAETDVSIRPSWFYHSVEDNQVKTVCELWDIYCTSVGRNSVLLLNLPPDMRGQLHAIDSTNVVGLRKVIDETFADNLLKDSKITSQNPRGARYEVHNLIDGVPDTYYASKDNTVKDVISFEMNKKNTFDCLMIQEVIELGHRTTQWSVDYSNDGKRWTTIPEAKNKQSIGHKWIVIFAPYYSQICQTAYNRR